jgi:cyclic pyranopterin phosphate synthase
MTTGTPTPRTPATPEPGAVLDTLSRPLRDLRISVTDRCNFRCTYCMPKEVFGRAYKFLARDEILTLEEIARVASVFVSLGTRKIRLTGGEPTVRKGLTGLVRQLAAIDGLEDLALTTNGTRMREMAAELREAGLKRVTVSLDSLDDDTFRSMNDVDFPVSQVLEGIDAARKAGFAPIKINVVVKRGVNEASITEIPRRFRGTDYIVRFIEFMDVGTTNGWRMDDMVPAAEILQRIDREMPIEPADANYGGEVARRWRFKDGSGEIGIISSVTQPFCGDCTRARLSADGKLYTCLFAVRGHDLRGLLRQGPSDEEIAQSVRGLWSRRKDRYSEQRTAGTAGLREKVEMSYIGG